MWIDDEANVRWYKDLYMKQGLEVAALKKQIEALKKEVKEVQSKAAYYKARVPPFVGDIWEKPQVIEVPELTSTTMYNIASSTLSEHENSYHVTLKARTSIPNKNEIGFSYYITKDIARFITPHMAASALTVVHREALDELTKQLFM